MHLIWQFCFFSSSLCRNGYWKTGFPLARCCSELHPHPLVGLASWLTASSCSPLTVQSFFSLFCCIYCKNWGYSFAYFFPTLWTKILVSWRSSKYKMVDIIRFWYYFIHRSWDSCSLPVSFGKHSNYWSSQRIRKRSDPTPWCFRDNSLCAGCFAGLQLWFCVQKELNLWSIH